MQSVKHGGTGKMRVLILKKKQKTGSTADAFVRGAKRTGGEFPSRTPGYNPAGDPNHGFSILILELFILSTGRRKLSKKHVDKIGATGKAENNFFIQSLTLRWVKMGNWLIFIHARVSCCLSGERFIEQIESTN